MIRIVLATWSLAGCVDDVGPRLDLVAPAAAMRDARVTITGRRLCGETGDCATAGGEVQIGLVSPVLIAPIVEYSDSIAVVVIPRMAEIGQTELVITVNERASNALDLEVLP